MEVYSLLKAIIFDFDYTLGDSTNGIALSINYALEKLGYAAPNIVDIKKSIGLFLTETYFALASNDNLYEAEQFVALFKEKADSVMIFNTELYAGDSLVDARTAENAKVKFAAVLTGTTTKDDF